MRFLAALACAAIITLLGLVPGFAETRVALVIGNSAYVRVPALPNPASDARAVADLFTKAGFDLVEMKTDLDGASMRRALRDFSTAVRDADVAVVYYAGHGMEVGGTNYLVPVDAVLEKDIDVEDETVSLDRVSQLIEPAKRLRLIIMDACRDNPFASGMKRSVASRSIGRGLAKVDVTTADTLVAFAARAGSTAADGDTGHSPYTAALLSNIATPGLDVRLALGRVRDQVLASTGGEQEPFVYGSLGGAEIPLVPSTKPADVASTASVPTGDSAAQAWADTKDTKDSALLREFIKRFGDSFYASLARARLQELKQGAAPAPAPAPSTTATASLSAKSPDVAITRSTPSPAPSPSAEAILRFNEPVTTGPMPVNGHSLAQLITGVPLFPPIDGLEESVWKKHCDSCHRWDQTSLCEQGKTYLKNPKAALRVSHPYGGPEKVAMMQWAKTGCQ
jgi:uncharacterized caspase-like protein